MQEVTPASNLDAFLPSNTPSPKPDPAMIKRSLVLTTRKGDVYELRTVGKTMSGYYTDLDEFAAAVVNASNMQGVTGVYLTINPCQPELLARRANHFSYAGRDESTKDKEILRRLALIVDIDSAVRQSGISATDVELMTTKAKAQEVRDSLVILLGVQPLTAMSGNGFHLRFNIDLPNDADSKILVKACLDSLAARFNDGVTKIDTTMFNASRICKVYGSVSAKGSNFQGTDTLEARPHRVCRILDDGDTTVLTREQLLVLAGEHYKPAPEKTSVTSPATSAPMKKGLVVKVPHIHDWTVDDVEMLLQSYGIEHDGAQMYETVGSKWQITCPFDESHAKPDACVYLFVDAETGKHYPTFKCSHDSCQQFKGWNALRKMLREMQPEVTVDWRDAAPTTSSTSTTPGYPVTGFIKGEFTPGEPLDWRKEFRNSSEMSSEPLKMLIERVIPEESACFIAGLSGHGKTLIALSLAKAFVYKTPLFGIEKFKVNEQLPILYLIPECGEKSFKLRLKAFHLTEEEIYAATGKKDMVLVRTLSQGETLQLDDERLLQACVGRVVILDTAIRFTNGSDENSASENAYLSQCIFKMLARGARKVIGIHHSPKNASGQDFMTLESVMRGSGDFGAMLGECYGVRMVDEDSTEIYIQNVKSRDMTPPGPFRIVGRPYIDQTGDFRALTVSGLTPTLAVALIEKAQDKKAASVAIMKAKDAKDLMDCFECFADGLSIEATRKQVGIGKEKANDFHKQYLENIAKKNGEVQ